LSPTASRSRTPPEFPEPALARAGAPERRRRRSGAGYRGRGRAARPLVAARRAARARPRAARSLALARGAGATWPGLPLVRRVRPAGGGIATCYACAGMRAVRGRLLAVRAIAVVRAKCRVVGRVARGLVAVGRLVHCLETARKPSLRFCTINTRGRTTLPGGAWCGLRLADELGNCTASSLCCSIFRSL
jgi:hypothetical protein